MFGDLSAKVILCAVKVSLGQPGKKHGCFGFLIERFHLNFLLISCDFIDFFSEIAYNKKDYIGKEESFMIVTATEFKTNFGKYLDLITQEDIFITRNGKTIAKVVNPHISAVDSLRGMLKDVPSDIDLDSLREERLSKYEDHV